ncbi:MAG: NUDIX domain-containing protein [Pseudomonadota bacterium]
MEIRDAATVILHREIAGTAHVLMGQRGAKAAFMPSKFVFPGGAVDADDARVPLAAPLPDPCGTRLKEDSARDLSHALAVAAIRELWEETGLALGRAAPWRDAPADWQSFAARGLQPDASALRFVFRAITPPGRPRRFDARFFLVPAEALATDPDDFSNASDELSHLQWVPLSEARSLDLPFITEVVLAEVASEDWS